MIAALLLVLLSGVAGLYVFRSEDLKTRSEQLTAGMLRYEVEDVLGPPELALRLGSNAGSVLVWEDQLWEVDVQFDRDGRVQAFACRASDSILRKTVGRIIDLPQ